MSDTYERPRRRPPKKPNYKPLIAAMSAVLAVLIIVAIVISVPGCDPGRNNPTLSTTVPTTGTTTIPTTLPTTGPTTLPTEPPVVKIGTATIAAMGDMLMHMPCIRPGKQADGSYDFAPYFAHVKDYLASADYAVANLETTLAGEDYVRWVNGQKIVGYYGYPSFNAPDDLISSLKLAGFDMLLTANNHTYDCSSVGFFRTQQVIMENGMDHIGTKPDAESDSYKIVEINGIRIGMINYTYETNSDPDKVDLNGGADLKENEKNLINVFLKDDVEGFKADLAEKLADMRADGAEAIVLYIHWGEEYQTKQNSQQKKMAQALFFKKSILFDLCQKIRPYT